VVEEMVSAASSDSSQKSLERALEVAANADMAIRNSSLQEKAWHPIQASAFSRIWPKVHAYLDKSDAIAFDGVYFGAVGIDEALRTRSVGFLFQSRDFNLYAEYVRSSLAEYFLFGALGQEVRFGGEPLGTVAEMEKVGKILRSAEPPWDRSEISVGGLDLNFTPGRVAPTAQALEGDALFAGFALLAAVAEYMDEDEFENMVKGLRETHGWPNLLLPWIMRRYDSSVGGLPDLPLDDELRALIETWGEGAWSAIKSRLPLEERSLGA
jgi:hypothetical protein